MIFVKLSTDAAIVGLVHKLRGSACQGWWFSGRLEAVEKWQGEFQLGARGK